METAICLHHRGLQLSRDHDEKEHTIHLHLSHLRPAKWLYGGVVDIPAGGCLNSFYVIDESQ